MKFKVVGSKNVPLTEDKVVKFDGQTYPNFGWCVIMCGGPGMGKSTVYKKLVPINAKVFDVDALKTFTLKTSEIDDNVITMRDGTQYNLNDLGIEAPYNLSNDKFTSFIHDKTRPLAKKVRKNVYGTVDRSDKDRLPNVLFDITGSNINDFVDIIDEMGDRGYKIAVVCVLGDVEQAADQNAQRPRKIKNDLLYSLHKDVLHSIENLIGDRKLLARIDSVWVVINFKYDTGDPNDVRRYIEKANVYQIKTVDDIVDLPKRVERTLRDMRVSVNTYFANKNNDNNGDNN